MFLSMLLLIGCKIFTAWKNDGKSMVTWYKVYIETASRYMFNTSFTRLLLIWICNSNDSSKIEYDSFINRLHKWPLKLVSLQKSRNDDLSSFWSDHMTNRVLNTVFWLECFSNRTVSLKYEVTRWFYCHEYERDSNKSLSMVWLILLKVSSPHVIPLPDPLLDHY